MDNRNKLFWNAVRFIVLAPYEGRWRDHKTVRIDCVPRVPADQLATAAHFTWQDRIFRFGYTKDILRPDPLLVSNPSNDAWDEKSDIPLFVFTQITNSGAVQEGVKAPGFYTSIFTITSLGHVLPKGFVKDMPGLVSQKMPGKKKKGKRPRTWNIVPADFIEKWLEGFDKDPL